MDAREKGGVGLRNLPRRASIASHPPAMILFVVTSKGQARSDEDYLDLLGLLLLLL